MTRRRLSPDARRAEIIETATALIAERGYHGLTLSMLAERCGITRAGLSHYFPTKESVFVAVLEHRDELDFAAEGFHDGDRRGYPGDVDEFLDAIARLIERNRVNPEIVRLYTILGAEALASDHPSHEFFQRRLVQVRGELTRSIALWHAAPDDLALETHAFLDGLQANWLRDPSIDMTAAWSRYGDRLRASLEEYAVRQGPART